MSLRLFSLATYFRGNEDGCLRNLPMDITIFFRFFKKKVKEYVLKLYLLPQCRTFMRKKVGCEPIKLDFSYLFSFENRKKCAHLSL